MKQTVWEYCRVPHNGDIWNEYFVNKEDAENAANIDWNHLTVAEKSNVEERYIVAHEIAAEGINMNVESLINGLFNGEIKADGFDPMIGFTDDGIRYTEKL